LSGYDEYPLSFVIRRFLGEVRKGELFMYNYYPDLLYYHDYCRRAFSLILNWILSRIGDGGWCIERSKTDGRTIGFIFEEGKTRRMGKGKGTRAFGLMEYIIFNLHVILSYSLVYL